MLTGMPTLDLYLFPFSVWLSFCYDIFTGPSTLRSKERVQEHFYFIANHTIYEMHLGIDVYPIPEYQYRNPHQLTKTSHL